MHSVVIHVSMHWCHAELGKEQSTNTDAQDGLVGAPPAQRCSYYASQLVTGPGLHKIAPNESSCCSAMPYEAIKSMQTSPRTGNPCGKAS